jgi:S-formylglutathione hydrolase FrmB
VGDVSLVDGWLPSLIIVVAPVTALLAVGWRRGVGKKQLAWGIAVSVGAIGGAALANRLFGLAPFSFPPSFYALAALVVFTTTVAIVGFRADGRWQRLDSVVAVVASIALIGVVVNGHYDYYPTVGNLFGKVSKDQLALPELETVRDQVRSSGELPKTGYTVHLSIPGTTSGFQAREAYVWFPPAYFAKDPPTLPVLMMLHGIPGGPADWFVGGEADDVADAFAAAHDGKAPILVMPDVTGSDFNDTECTDSPRGKVETYLTTDVPDYVTKNLGVEADGTEWGVAGLSMGGYCAVMLSLRHPTQFTVFGDYSGLDRPTIDPPGSALTDLFAGDQATLDAYSPMKILDGRTFAGTAGWFEVGQQDSEPLQDTEELAGKAQAAGLATCVLVRPGGHNFDFWHTAFEHSLPWMSARLGLVPEPVDTFGATCSAGTAPSTK